MLGRRLSECMSRRWQAKGQGDVGWVADGIGVSKKRADVLELSRGRLFPLVLG